MSQIVHANTKKHSPSAVQSTERDPPFNLKGEKLNREAVYFAGSKSTQRTDFTSH
jgi:hypothetical protein